MTPETRANLSFACVCIIQRRFACDVNGISTGADNRRRRAMTSPRREGDRCLRSAHVVGRGGGCRRGCGDRHRDRRGRRPRRPSTRRAVRRQRRPRLLRHAPRLPDRAGEPSRTCPSRWTATSGSAARQVPGEWWFVEGRGTRWVAHAARPHLVVGPRPAAAAHRGRGRPAAGDVRRRALPGVRPWVLGASGAWSASTPGPGEGLGAIDLPHRRMSPPPRVVAVTDDGLVVGGARGFQWLWRPLVDGATLDLAETAPGQVVIGSTDAGLVVNEGPYGRTDGATGEPYLAADVRGRHPAAAGSGADPRRPGGRGRVAGLRAAGLARRRGAGDPASSAWSASTAPTRAWSPLRTGGCSRPARLEWETAERLLVLLVSPDGRPGAGPVPPAHRVLPSGGRA